MSAASFGAFRSCRKHRNDMAARFLASDCTDLVMIEDDIARPLQAVVRLQGSDEPFEGGV